MTSSQMRSDIPGAYEPRCRRWNLLPQEPAPPPGIRRAWSSAALPPRRHRTSDARCPPSPRSRSLPCRPPTSPRLCAGDQGGKRVSLSIHVNVGNDELWFVLARGYFIYVRTLLSRFLFSLSSTSFVLLMTQRSLASPAIELLLNAYPTQSCDTAQIK